MVPLPYRRFGAPLIALLLAAPLLAGCLSEPGDDAAPGVGNDVSHDIGNDLANDLIVSSECEGTPASADAVHATLHTSMGDIVIRLATDGAPGTSANFLSLAEDGFYEGILFHRVIGPQKSPPNGFMLQTGDPNTKDKPASTWGQGGSAEIPDEFHPDLRHDAAGVVSMANRGPNTGSSQFFITLAPTPHLDDRHSVFGRVVEGMDVVRAIGAVATDDSDRPVENVAIKNVTIATQPLEQAVGAKVVLSEKRIGMGRSAQFILLGFNEGNALDRLGFTAAVPEGWSASFDLPCVDVLPDAARVSILTVTPSPDFAGTQRLDVGVMSSGGARADATVQLTVGEVGSAAMAGSQIRGNYVGILENGRVFDTSLASVAHDDEMPKSSSFNVRPSYQPFSFQVGGQVIQGFSDLATGAREGETPAGRIPPEQAYGPPGAGHALSGRTLIFELEMLDIS